MAERFQKLFSLTPNQFADGCPIAVEAGALQKDNESGAVLAQIKMRNLGETPITSCKVSLKAYENNGNKVEDIESFAYLDLNAERGKEFGSKTPIFLQDKTARSFEVDIKEIVFSDGTVKEFSGNEWKQMPEPKKTEEVLTDPEIRKQYNIESGGNCQYYPEKRDGFFLCTCGAVNLGEEQTCYKCGRSYESITPLLDVDTLTEKAVFRQTAEAEKKEKNKKMAIIGGALLAAIILLFAIVSIVQKATTLPFAIGDSYDDVNTYMKSHAKEYDTGTYLNNIYGWADYFGVGSNDYTQQVTVYFDSNDKVDGIYIDALDKYRDKIINKLKKVYNIDPSSVTVSDNTIKMKGDEVYITIETGYVWKDTALHNPGEEVVSITIYPGF